MGIVIELAILTVVGSLAYVAVNSIINQMKKAKEDARLESLRESEQHWVCLAKDPYIEEIYRYIDTYILVSESSDRSMDEFNYKIIGPLAAKKHFNNCGEIIIPEDVAFGIWDTCKYYKGREEERQERFSHVLTTDQMSQPRVRI